MKNIITMTVKECFDHIMNSEEKYSIIHIQNKEEKSSVSFNKTENCIDVLAITFTDEYDFTLYLADRIIRFCERQFDIENVIIAYECEAEYVFDLAKSIENCFGLKTEEVRFENKIYRCMRLKNYEIKNSLLHTLSPIEYCLKILDFTAEQVRELENMTNEAGYGCSEFFWYRQCDIFLKNGTIIQWTIETDFCDIIIPEHEDIEYIRFVGVPEIASPSSFKNDDAYGEDCIYGVYDFYGDEFTLDSERGIIREKFAPIPEKYRNYTIYSPLI